MKKYSGPNGMFTFHAAVACGQIKAVGGRGSVGHVRGRDHCQ